MSSFFIFFFSSRSRHSSLLFFPALRLFFFFSSRRRHTRSLCDWSSDVCSSDLRAPDVGARPVALDEGDDGPIGHLQAPVGVDRDGIGSGGDLRLWALHGGPRLAPTGGHERKGKVWDDAVSVSRGAGAELGAQLPAP